MELQLTLIETRIIGSLIEKEIATPEYYPLTLNALVNACNQKSSRDPVTSFTEPEIEDALNILRDKGLARRVTGSDMRVPRFKQTFTEHFQLTPQETACIAVLFLRGPQTAGEIRTRSGRLYEFQSLHEVDETFSLLESKAPFPFVIKLPKQPGTKENRFSHLFSGTPEFNITETKPIEITSPLSERISSLEDELKKMRKDFEALKEEFFKFKKTFD